MTARQIPVVRRGEILGYARTLRGALRIARRVALGDTCSVHTATLRDDALSEQDILLCRHQLAWWVGTRLRSHQ